ncbi:MAG: serine/threonine-protein kinase [Phycisphaerales bacterium]
MPASQTITLTRTAALPGQAPADEVIVPRRLGSVTLTRELGRGGMGVVWLGRDELLDRDVAVKFLLAAVCAPDDPRFATFLDGAKAAAALRHPNVTSVLNAGLVEESGGIPYLVMEYIDGPSASQLIASRGPLSLPIALTVIEGACLATAELHAKDIIHRDLKPGNIMLSMTGGIFVTDFGLALARHTTAHGSTRASIAGSPPYMAPEMFRGEVSPKTDVYALGVTLHELLTAQVPFAGSFDDLEKLHEHAPVPREKLDARNVPAELAEVIERAMHKNALFRYRSAEHLRGAIHLACPRPDLWSRGSIDLAALVSGEPAGVAAATGTAGGSGSKGEPTPSLSYYEAIGSRARQRRQELESTRDEIDSERRRLEDARREEERRVSEAIQRRREESRLRHALQGPTDSPGPVERPGDPRAVGETDPVGACEQCGYLLVGTRAEQNRAVCPECGTSCDPAAPWRARPWPAMPRLVVMLCGPTIAGVLMFFALAAVPVVRHIGTWPLLLVGACVLAGLAFAVPVAVARRVARACEPRRQRRPAARRVLLPAIIANSLVVVVALMCFLLLVR